MAGKTVPRAKVYYDRSPVMFKIGPLRAWEVDQEVTVERPEGSVKCKVESVDPDGMANAYRLDFLNATDEQRSELQRELWLGLNGET